MKKTKGKKVAKGITPFINEKAITENGKNHLLKQMRELGEKNIFLGEEIGPELVYSKIQKIQQLLNRPSFIPKDQTNCALVGSGIKGYLNGNKETEHVLSLEGPVSIENKLPANHKIIPSDSPFGTALLGKKKGETVTYKAAGLTFYFEITDLFPYSEVKDIFFPSDVKEVDKKIEIETEVMV
ncbi:MAG: GreA/GreB family elongation factor [Minisyncoccia bacterium]